MVNSLKNLELMMNVNESVPQAAESIDKLAASFKITFIS